MAKLNINEGGKMGGRMTARNTTGQVREHMWLARDDTSQWGPGWKTNREVYDSVTSARGAGTSTQAIRRSLNWLVVQGLVEKDSAQDPEIFRWVPGKAFPGNPPPAPSTAKIPWIPPVSSPGANNPAPDRREELHNILRSRIEEPGTAKKAEKPAKPPRRGIIRANGQLYLPRSLGGQDISDVDALRQLRAAGLFPLLYGPPGTGKSVLPEAAFGVQLVIFEGNEDSSVDDLVGTYTQARSGWVWTDGPAVIAAKQGRPLFLDDMTLVSPKVLAALYPLMDGRREIWLPQHILTEAEAATGDYGTQVAGEREHVQAADGFWVIGAHNPGVHGAILTDALRSRFTVTIEVETDLELVAELGVPEKFVRLARNLRTKKKNNDIQWTPQLRELLAAKRTAGLFSEEVAAANLAGVAPEEDRDIVLDMMRTIWGSDIKPLNLRGQI